MSDLIRYIDATNMSDRRVDYPGGVDEFLGLGFSALGRMLVEPTNGTLEQVAAGYAEDLRTLFLAHCDIPTPILRAPDGSAFVEVSWFWGSPSVRIRSLLADGSLVETNRRWENPPGLPVVLAKYWTHIDIDRDMTKRSVPARGRSIEVVATQDAAMQWRRHQEHLARYRSERGAGVVGHDSLGQCMELALRAHRHDAAVERRTVGFWRPLVIGYGVVAGAVGIGLASAGHVQAAVVTTLALALATPIVVRLVIGKVRILSESRRPPFV